MWEKTDTFCSYLCKNSKSDLKKITSFYNALCYRITFKTILCFLSLFFIKISNLYVRWIHTYILVLFYFFCQTLFAFDFLNCPALIDNRWRRSGNIIQFFLYLNCETSFQFKSGDFQCDDLVVRKCDIYFLLGMNFLNCPLPLENLVVRKYDIHLMILLFENMTCNFF